MSHARQPRIGTLPGWRNGIRSRLKIDGQFKAACGFESRPGHTNGLPNRDSFGTIFSVAPIAQLVEHSPLKRRVVGSNPTGRTSTVGVAKLVDARALGARGAICGGSSPLPGTANTCSMVVTKRLRPFIGWEAFRI